MLRRSSSMSQWVRGAFFGSSSSGSSSPRRAATWPHSGHSQVWGTSASVDIGTVVTWARGHS